MGEDEARVHEEEGDGSGEGTDSGDPAGFSHVYVREGAVVGPLDATYRGPYRVLMKEQKKFLLHGDRASRTWVSVTV